MTEYAVSYAEALYSLASDEKKSDIILNDLRSICIALAENEGYVKLINAPDIVFEEKQRLIDEAFGASVDKYVLNLLKILAKNRLFNIVVSLKDEYEKSYNKDNNIEKATVICAFELSEALREKLEAKLNEITKKTVAAEYVTDKSVLGGFVVRFSDSQIDASIKGRLEALKEKLLAI